MSVMLTVSIPFDDDISDEGDIKVNAYEALAGHVKMIEEQCEFNICSHVGPGPNDEIAYVSSYAVFGVVE